MDFIEHRFNLKCIWKEAAHMHSTNHKDTTSADRCLTCNRTRSLKLMLKLLPEEQLSSQSHNWITGLQYWVAIRYLWHPGNGLRVTTRSITLQGHSDYFCHTSQEAHCDCWRPAHKMSQKTNHLTTEVLTGHGGMFGPPHISATWGRARTTQLRESGKVK